jgi:outer membrane immunogenic protein
VLGAEWEFDWAENNDNNRGVVLPAVGIINVTSKDRWVTTFAARFGVSYDGLLLYGKAGGGWVGNDGFTVTNVATTNGTSIFTSGTNSRGGWLVGAGFEWGCGRWSPKIEYDYLALSGRTFGIPITSPFLAGDIFTAGSHNIHMVKIGVNYRFY